MFRLRPYTSAGHKLFLSLLMNRPLDSGIVNFGRIQFRSPLAEQGQAAGRLVFSVLCSFLPLGSNIARRAREASEAGERAPSFPRCESLPSSNFAAGRALAGIPRGSQCCHTLGIYNNWLENWLLSLECMLGSFITHEPTASVESKREAWNI